MTVIPALPAGSIILTAKIIGKKAVLPAVTLMEGERMVDEITFLIDANYNGTDLSSMNAYANIERSDGSTDKILLETLLTESVLSVKWVIDASVTAVAGELSAQISFVDDEGETVFATERFTLQINSSIDAYEDLTDREPNALYRLQQAMYNYVDRMQDILDDVNARIAALGNDGEGSGGESQGSSGTVIDANNKLSVAYIDGLADVATSGSYYDLVDAPDEEDLLYYILQGLEPVIEEVTTMLTPCVIKYISFNDSPSVMTSLLNENKEVIRDYLDAGLFVREMILWDQSTNYFYQLQYVSFSNNQYNFVFRKGNSYYTAVYNMSTGSYGFSE